MQDNNLSAPTDDDKGHRLSIVLVNLYKGVLYKEQNEELWRDMHDMSSAVIDHFAQIGLKLAVDENEGYAYVAYSSEQEAEDEESEALPRLVVKRQLTFPVSLMLALLRKRLAEFDTAGEGTRLVMTRDEIVDMMRPFLPESTNEVKLTDKIDAAISKVKELSFIRPMKSEESSYEVMRILKAFIDAEWLTEFDSRLESYIKYAERDKS